MQKTILILVFLFSSIFSFSQITVVASDLMMAGDEFYQGLDDNPSIILGTPGGNKNWNFSFLNAIDEDTISIVAPAGTPYASSYTNANLCMITSESGWSGTTINYTYMNKDNTGIYVLGESDAVLPAPTMFMPLPLTYGSNHVDGPVSVEDQMYSGWQLNWYYPDTLAPLFTGGTCHTIDSALVSASITNTFDVDGWGTATMPDGNDYDALRVMVEQDYTYTVQIYCTDTLTGTGSGWFPGGGDSDLTNEIHFVSNHPDIRYSLVTLKMDSTYVESAAFLNSSALSSVNTIESNIFNVYPIPSSYDITIETNSLSDNNKYELFDLNGKPVKENNFFQSAQINLSNLAKGTYLLKIHDENGYVNKKIIVE
tara:strand:- start:50 stop:1156 length:1107 start_codon:yes stop_codon:yes gene_type:complete